MTNEEKNLKILENIVYSSCSKRQDYIDGIPVYWMGGELVSAKEFNDEVIRLNPNWSVKELQNYLLCEDP